MVSNGSLYREKRQLIEKIKDYDAHIRSNTEKKKKAMEKLKEVSRLAMAEEYNCKPHELDEIIEKEHSIMQKLRASGLSDEELLEMVGSKTVDATDSGNAITDEQTSFFDVKNQY